MISRFILGASLLSLASCGSEKADPNPSPLGCEVALAYAEAFAGEVRTFDDFEGRKLALSTSPDWLVPTQKDLETLVAQDPKRVDDPDHELTAAAVRQRDLSVLNQCPNLREWVERENILSDEDEIDRLTQPEDWTIVILTMSMPVITPDAQEALVYAGKYAGGLSGVSLAVSYRRSEKGDWEMIDEQVLAVS